MFVRKRIKKLKNGKTAEYYQAVESYRENGKVKQRVVALDKSKNISNVLEQEISYLIRMEKDLEVPFSEWKEIKWRKGIGLVVVSLSREEVEKRKARLRVRRQKQIEKVTRLESLANKT